MWTKGVGRVVIFSQITGVRLRGGGGGGGGGIIFKYSLGLRDINASG